MKNLRITKAEFLVYIAPLAIGLLGKLKHSEDIAPLWIAAIGLLVVTSVVFGIWVSAPIVRRALAVTYVLAWAGDYIGSMLGKDLDNWLVGCGLVCFWITCYLNGQAQIDQTWRWRRERD